MGVAGSQIYTVLFPDSTNKHVTKMSTNRQFTMYVLKFTKLSIKLLIASKFYVIINKTDIIS